MYSSLIRGDQGQGTKFSCVFQVALNCRFESLLLVINSRSLRCLQTQERSIVLHLALCHREIFNFKPFKELSEPSYAVLVYPSVIWELFLRLQYASFSSRHVL